ncbi:MAG TPA: tripartite tricarboxylate transporter substrate binding protein [Casimicrobiaceae bacterium]|nr:tripartite tricarboxylate transporter substrate binding protein [Casimicrobiaceae bacterium]
MRITRFTRCLAAVAAVLTLLPLSARADGYPDKPIHMVVPFAAGGAVDVVARIVGQALSDRVKQPVIVENKPGASSNIGMGFVAKAAPDGYTLLMASNGIATNNALFPDLAFDGRKDFAPVARVGYAPLVFVVPEQSADKTLAALIADAKAHPGKLAFGSAGNGTSGHLAGELFKTAAGIDVLHVPYKGGSPAITDLLGQRLSFMPINPIEVLGHIKAGRLRALAVASDKRLPYLPDVPTAAQAGLPGFQATVWWGVVAPARTPAAVVAQLNAEINQALADPAVAKRLQDAGVVITPQTPAQFGQFIGTETELWSRVIKAAGIKAN